MEEQEGNIIKDATARSSTPHPDPHTQTKSKGCNRRGGAAAAGGREEAVADDDVERTHSTRASTESGLQQPVTATKQGEKEEVGDDSTACQRRQWRRPAGRRGRQRDTLTWLSSTYGDASTKGNKEKAAAITGPVGVPWAVRCPETPAEARRRRARRRRTHPDLGLVRSQKEKGEGEPTTPRRYRREVARARHGGSQVPTQDAPDSPTEGPQRQE
jgi:hypothetical protein